jgi:hypothetical protein
MAQGMRQWGRITPETTFGTYNVSGTANWVRLTGDNASTIEPTPQRFRIKSADGGNKVVMSGANRVKVEGNISTYLYPSQAGSFLALATTLTSFDLGSFTYDHFDSVRLRRYLGCKVAKATITCAAESDEGNAKISLDIVAQKQDSVDPTLAEPAVTVFPTGLPYTIQELSGALTIGASARTAFKSLAIAFNNTLAANFESGVYVNNVTHCGREILIDADLQYASATDRAAWEAQTAQTLTAVFTKVSPAKILTLTFNAANRINSLSRTLPLGDVSRQGIQLQSQVDGTNGDFSYTEV